MDLVLPVPVELFTSVLAEVDGGRLNISTVGLPTSRQRVLPYPQHVADLRRDEVSYALRISGGYREGPPPFNEQYVAFVVDDMVVAVENQLGFYSAW